MTRFVDQSYDYTFSAGIFFSIVSFDFNYVVELYVLDASVSNNKNYDVRYLASLKLCVLLSDVPYVFLQNEKLFKKDRRPRKLLCFE